MYKTRLRGNMCRPSCTSASERWARTICWFRIVGPQSYEAYSDGSTVRLCIQMDRRWRYSNLPSSVQEEVNFYAEEEAETEEAGRKPGGPRHSLP